MTRFRHTGVLLTAGALLTGAAFVGNAASQDEEVKEKKEASQAKAGDAGAEAVQRPEAGVALIVPMKGYKARGFLTLKQQSDGVQVTGRIRGLEPGKHGFHIHEFGDLRDREGKAAGGHFNPTGHKHGAPDDEEHHAGDLGNVTANDQGVAEVDVLAKGLELHFVIGRSFVVHAGADDLKSQPSGDAGPRAGVGVIGIAQPEEMK